MKQGKNMRWDPIPVLCVALCLALWLCRGFAHWGSDWLAGLRGTLQPFSLTAEQLTPVNLHPVGDSRYETETGDPQLLWQNPDGRRIRSVTLDAAFSATTREMCLYYTTAPGQDFSLENRVFPREGADGTYRFVLPVTAVDQLRLDPCSPLTGQTMEITLHSLEANTPVPFWQYFAPTWAGVMQAALYTALLCAGLCIVRDAGMWYKRK